MAWAVRRVFDPANSVDVPPCQGSLVAAQVMYANSLVLSVASAFAQYFRDVMNTSKVFLLAEPLRDLKRCRARNGPNPGTRSSLPWKRYRNEAAERVTPPSSISTTGVLMERDGRDIGRKFASFAPGGESSARF